MGHWTGDRDCEPTQLTVVTRMGAFLSLAYRAQKPRPGRPQAGFCYDRTNYATFFTSRRIVLRVIVFAAEHLSVERKGGGYFIALLSGGVGSGGVDDVALGKHGLRNALA